MPRFLREEQHNKHIAGSDRQQGSGWWSKPQLKMSIQVLILFCFCSENMSLLEFIQTTKKLYCGHILLLFIRDKLQTFYSHLSNPTGGECFLVQPWVKWTPCMTVTLHRLFALKQCEMKVWVLKHAFQGAISFHYHAKKTSYLVLKPCVAFEFPCTASNEKKNTGNYKITVQPAG